MLRKLRNPQVLIQKTKVKFWRTKQGKWVIGIMIAIVGTILIPIIGLILMYLHSS